MPLTTRSMRPVSWTLLLVTDGRDDYLADAVASADAMLPDPARRVMVDDTGSAEHASMLRGLYPRFEVHDAEKRRGLAGAVRAGWGVCDTDYVFHLEDDFTFNEPTDIAAMAGVLDAHPKLAQMCLLRQPWNAEEQAAGGIVEKDPGDYRHSHVMWPYEAHWLTHRRLFSLNPCLIPRRVYELGWDDGNERGFTDRLLADGYNFAYWGQPGDPPRVTHIGRRRAVGWSL